MTSSHIYGTLPSVSFSLLPIQLPGTPSHISLHIQHQDKDAGTILTYERPCVKILRSRAVVLLAQVGISVTVDEGSNAGGGGGVRSRYTHIHIRPFLRLPFSLSLPLSLSAPSPPPSIFLSHPPFIPPSLAASRRVYETPRQRRHHGVVWSRLEVPDVDRIPNWVGGVSIKGRLAVPSGTGGG